MDIPPVTEAQVDRAFQTFLSFMMGLGPKDEEIEINDYKMRKVFREILEAQTYDVYLELE